MKKVLNFPPTNRSYLDDFINPTCNKLYYLQYTLQQMALWLA